MRREKGDKLSNPRIIHVADATDNLDYIGARPRMQACTI